MDFPGHSFLPIIQASITPVILISGTGMLMLTLTNRLGRAVDRTRALAGQMRTATGTERASVEEQLDILFHRTSLIRQAVTLAVTSILLECVLVLAIFVGALLQKELTWVIAILFVASMLLLISTLVAFLRDIGVALQALRIEVEHARSGKP